MRRVLFFHAGAFTAFFLLAVVTCHQREIKAHFRMGTVNITRLRQFAVGNFNRVGNQLFAGGKGKIVPQILIAIEVNLGRQMFKAGIFMVAGFLVLGALIIALIPMSKTQPQNAAAPLST